MNAFFIHYRPDDGEIFGWGSGFVPEPIEGNAVALLDQPFVADPATHKFNGKAVIEKTAAEQRAARLPTLREVQEAIYLELVRTDLFMLSDYPNGGVRDWQHYRQMLRDLSKHYQNAGDMIKNCGTAPDGTDPMTNLRARL